MQVQRATCGVEGRPFATHRPSACPAPADKSHLCPTHLLALRRKQDKLHGTMEVVANWPSGEAIGSAMDAHPASFVLQPAPRGRCIRRRPNPTAYGRGMSMLMFMLMFMLRFMLMFICRFFVA